MDGELTIIVKEAIKEGILRRAHELLTNALKNETRAEIFYPLLGELAYKLKQEGLLENAVEVLETKCKLSGDRGDKTALQFWLDELNMTGWSMARRDSHHSSMSTIDDRNQLSRFRPLWSYVFPNGQIGIQETINLPSPIIARDMLITFNESLQGFIGLELESGVMQWESGIVAERLDYSMTPVYLRPNLFFAVPRSIKRIMMYNPIGTVEILKTSQYIQIMPYSAPLISGKVIVFSFLSHVFIYDHECGKENFYSVSLKKDEILRAPVSCNSKVFFLSNFGKLFHLSEGKGNSEIHCIKELPSDNDVVYSAPCTVGDTIYFEAVNREGLRQVGCYIPHTDLCMLNDLKDEFCNISHSHLDFTPICVGDGALFCSDTHPRLYKARQADDMIEIIPINIRSQISSVNIDPLSQIYSSTLNSYLLSKSFGGFLYVNLINGIATNEAFQPQRWEIISQPIIYRNKILFVCKEGVICYEAV